MQKIFPADVCKKFHDKTLRDVARTEQLLKKLAVTTQNAQTLSDLMKDPTDINTLTQTQILVNNMCTSLSEQLLVLCQLNSKISQAVQDYQTKANELSKKQSTQDSSKKEATRNLILQRPPVAPVNTNVKKTSSPKSPQIQKTKEIKQVPPNNGTNIQSKINNGDSNQSPLIDDDPLSNTFTSIMTPKIEEKKNIDDLLAPLDDLVIPNEDNPNPPKKVEEKKTTNVLDILYELLEPSPTNEKEEMITFTDEKTQKKDSILAVFDNPTPKETIKRVNSNISILSDFLDESPVDKKL